MPALATHQPDEQRACPACGSAGGHPPAVVAGKRGLDGHPLRITRCTSCGCRFQPTVPSLADLTNHYDYMAHVEQGVELTPILAERLRRLVDRLGPPPSPGARVLEVGAGGGLALGAAERAGWEAWATEISPSCVELLRPKMGDRLFAGALPEATFAPESFDAAILIEVIEHLDDPVAYLKCLHRLLRPGARVLMTTPNGAGASARLLGLRWRVFGDEHLSYFDSSSLTRLLARAGFEVESLETSNIDVAPLTGPLFRLLRRWRPRSSAPMESAPVGETVRPGRSARATRLSDLAIEALNRVINSTGMGDGIKLVARRR